MVNPTSNKILERIHHILGNLVQTYHIKETYVEEYDPWLGILAVAAFEILSTENSLKGYIPGQLLFGRDVIILIENTVGWELIRQRKQTQN